jgi:hypothetical protein
MRRLLSAAVRDDVGVRDDLRGFVLEHFVDLATRCSDHAWVLTPHARHAAAADALLIAQMRLIA